MCFEFCVVNESCDEQLPSTKLTWQWKNSIFNRRYIFKRLFFHCQPESHPKEVYPGAKQLHSNVPGFVRLCRRDFQQAKRTKKRNNNEKLLGNGFLLATTFVLFGRVAFLLGRSFHHVGFNCKASSLSRGNKHIREILNWFILLPIFGRFAKIFICKITY